MSQSGRELHEEVSAKFTDMSQNVPVEYSEVSNAINHFGKGLAKEIQNAVSFHKESDPKEYAQICMVLSTKMAQIQSMLDYLKELKDSIETYRTSSGNKVPQEKRAELEASFNKNFEAAKHLAAEIISDSKPGQALDNIACRNFTYSVHAVAKYAQQPTNVTRACAVVEEASFLKDMTVSRAWQIFKASIAMVAAVALTCFVFTIPLAIAAGAKAIQLAIKQNSPMQAAAGDLQKSMKETAEPLAKTANKDEKKGEEKKDESIELTNQEPPHQTPRMG